MGQLGMPNELGEFYPSGLNYSDSIVCNPNAMSGDSVHLFSWVTPLYANCRVRESTIQDISFSIYCGDTLEPATMLSGAPTQFTFVVSP